MPRFAVLIPTRDRAETVVRAVASVLVQPASDLEVLVHDNSTDSATVEALGRIEDRRLRVVRHAAPLTMTGNWQVGLGLLDAERVMVLGDDDALMPAAVATVERLIDADPELVVTWDKVKYSWPQRGLDRNKLKLPAASPDRMQQSRALIERTIRDARAYERLPMLYSSFVPMALLDEIARRAGRLVGSQSPDVYSGTAVALLTRTVLRSGLPLSVSGLSRWSNGANAIVMPANPEAAEWRERNAAAGLALHPWLPDVRGLPTAVYDSVLRAAEDVGVDLRRHRPAIIRQVIAGTRAFDPEEAARFEEEVLRAARPDRRALRAAQRELRRNPIRASRDPSIERTRVRPTVGRDGVRIDAADFGVTDVAEAAELAHRFYDWSPAARAPLHEPVLDTPVRRTLIRLADGLRRRASGAPRRLPD